MSFHTNFDSWNKMKDPTDCPVCQNKPMQDGMADVVELPYSWLNAQPVECLKGACHLVAKKHVIELYELNHEELLGLMKDVQICAQALQSVTGAVKINYEIHGNSCPHLHIHLYPRYIDDPFPGQPIDYRKKMDQYEADSFERFVNSLRENIQELAESQ